MGASGNLQSNPMTSPVGNAKLTSTLVGDGKETLMARHQRDHGEGHRGNVMPKMKADSLAPGVYGRETRANPSRSTETERSHATFIRNEGKAMTSSIAVRNSFAKQNALAVPLFHLAAILRMASHQVHGIATLLNVWLERRRTAAVASKMLSALSDRELRDIGVTRFDVQRAQWGDSIRD